LRRTIERHPDAEGAHYLAAQIAERRGDSSGAEREYRREIELQLKLSKASRRPAYDTGFR
jgi:Tfp pilus assembly protein PilF